MAITSELELIALRKVGKVVALTREALIRSIKPGITTAELDGIAGQILRRFGAKSAPQLLYGFPGLTCISINDEVAHGIPGDRVIIAGDQVNIDVSAELDGFYADTGATVLVEPVSALQRELCNCSQNALNKAIETAVAGYKINQIGRVIHNEAKSNGFTVIKNLTGHGIGRKLHEEPHHIPNYFDRWDNKVLTAGLVLAIETFVSTGAEFVRKASDGWTLKTPDQSLVAQFEHTIVVTNGRPIILTVV